jgi:hypothetical protein
MESGIGPNIFCGLAGADQEAGEALRICQKRRSPAAVSSTALRPSASVANVPVRAWPLHEVGGNLHDVLPIREHPETNDHAPLRLPLEGTPPGEAPRALRRGSNQRTLPLEAAGTVSKKRRVETPERFLPVGGLAGGQFIYLKDHPNPKAVEFCLCGPPMMIKACTQMLSDMGVAPAQIAFDEF